MVNVIALSLYILQCLFDIKDSGWVIIIIIIIFGLILLTYNLIILS